MRPFISHSSRIRPFNEGIIEDGPYKGNKSKIVPCGAIANSMFNDTFTLRRKFDNGSLSEPLSWSDKEIAWDVDTSARFSA